MSWGGHRAAVCSGDGTCAWPSSTRNWSVNRLQLLGRGGGPAQAGEEPAEVIEDVERGVQQPVLDGAQEPVQILGLIGIKADRLVHRVPPAGAERRTHWRKCMGSVCSR